MDSLQPMTERFFSSLLFFSDMLQLPCHTLHSVIMLNLSSLLAFHTNFDTVSLYIIYAVIFDVHKSNRFLYFLHRESVNDIQILTHFFMKLS